MKIKNKFLLVIVFLVVFGFLFTLNIERTLAQSEDPVIFTPQVTIPRSIFERDKQVEIQESTRSIAEYFRSIYNYLLAVVGLLAAIVLMISGIVWMTSAGNTQRISQAKNWMTGSLTGLVLMLTSYLILKTINPYLVDFKITPIQTIATIDYGCCKLSKNIDITGMFTGTNNRPMTFTTAALDCYVKARQLGEPGIDSPEKLKELGLEKDIQSYLVSKGKFVPNSISTEFTKCDEVGYCFSSPGIVNPDVKSDIYCYRTIKDACLGFFTNEITCNEDKSAYQNYINAIYDPIKKVLPSINIPSIDNFNFVKSGCSQDFELCSPAPSGGLVNEVIAGVIPGYCYNGLCMAGNGKLGEGCGDDGGICVARGPDCSDYPGLIGRERRGGRSCDLDGISGIPVKCCY